MGYRRWSGKGYGAKRYCEYGHDKTQVGVTHKGQCARCHVLLNRLYRRKREAASLMYIHGLKEKRLDLGLSQRQLADLAGIERKTISLIERGKRRSIAGTRKKIIGAILAKEDTGG
jgi:DNA-binding XRE family transcriptional regulator